MAMTLQEAIDFASVPANSQPYGLDTYVTISMHDDSDTVLFGGGGLGGAGPTFRPDLPLLNWGTGTIAGGAPSSSVVASWFKYRGQVPGFSTRGLGGMTLNVATRTAVPTPTPIPIDFSVRRDPGYGVFGRFGWAPSIQIEIEVLGAGGAVTNGVLLNASQDGTLLRALGPSVRDPANTASYTVTINVWTRIG